MYDPPSGSSGLKFLHRVCVCVPFISSAKSICLVGPFGWITFPIHINKHPEFPLVNQSLE